MQTHNFRVFVLVEYIKCRSQGSTKDGRILCSVLGQYLPLGRIYTRGMMVSLLRRSESPIVEISRPSTVTHPSVASTKRKNESARVLFPEPVRPRMPI